MDKSLKQTIKILERKLSIKEHQIKFLQAELNQKMLMLYKITDDDELKERIKDSLYGDCRGINCSECPNRFTRC